jgi:hypothetical protein
MFYVTMSIVASFPLSSFLYLSLLKYEDFMGKMNLDIIIFL